MKIKCLCTIIFCTILLKNITAQLGINATNAAPNSKAMLDVESTSKGVLIPRMTTTQRNAIASPPAGLMIYNSTVNKFNYFNGGVWSEFVVGGFTLPFFAQNDGPTPAFQINNYSTDVSSSGIFGITLYGTGVKGFSEYKIGIDGGSYDGIGVYGHTDGYFSTTAVGVKGQNFSNYGIGVQAINSGEGNAGVALEVNGPVKVAGNKFVFTHTATVANKISANGTDVDNSFCNNDPNALLIVTQKINSSGTIYNNSPIGTYYNTTRNKWEIRNQNGTAIPTNAQFTVMVIKQ
jgi:hypothetical protein